MDAIISKIDFTVLDAPIPESVFTMPLPDQKEVFDYIQQMDDIHKRAYKIAFEHLNSSFNIFKSIGFKDWKNQQK